jgi:hypothetical protein
MTMDDLTKLTVAQWAIVKKLLREAPPILLPPLKRGRQ